MQRAANKLVILGILSVVDVSRAKVQPFNVQMHLPIPERSLSKHVLGDPANLGSSNHRDLSIVATLFLIHKPMSMYENPEMASFLLV